ncbi:hypothetical protein FGO68_gene5125 [Halteria grandinella]|uniref:Uncharacterized protein n=1 Tax=Halteria grandinella TaxID=5974 RepID=A0A8J8NB19_HALGN|nr:hypothetical protein FGO68_gene5125 [Halteria grandinella]
MQKSSHIIPLFLEEVEHTWTTLSQLSAIEALPLHTLLCSTPLHVNPRVNSLRNMVADHLSAKIEKARLKESKKPIQVDRAVLQEVKKSSYKKFIPDNTFPFLPSQVESILDPQTISEMITCTKEQPITEEHTVPLGTDLEDISRQVRRSYQHCELDAVKVVQDQQTTSEQLQYRLAQKAMKIIDRSTYAQALGLLQERQQGLITLYCARRWSDIVEEATSHILQYRDHVMSEFESWYYLHTVRQPPLSSPSHPSPLLQTLSPSIEREMVFLSYDHYLPIYITTKTSNEKFLHEHLGTAHKVMNWRDVSIFTYISSTQEDRKSLFERAKRIATFLADSTKVTKGHYKPTDRYLSDQALKSRCAPTIPPVRETLYFPP